MRKYFIIIVVLICPYLVFAQKYVTTPKQSKAEKVYDNLINKLDIIQYLNIDSRYNESSFWESLENNHQTLQKYRKDVYKNKEAANKAKEYIRKQLTEIKSEDLIFMESNDITEELKNSICGPNSKYPISISVVHDKSANAVIFPNGEMYITDSLFYLLNFSKEKLIGICAHEMGHYIIQHAYIHQWKSFKNERNNTIVAAVMSGIVAAADTYATSQGAKVEYESTSKLIENTFDAAATASYLYRFKYSREQELEADIIAVRLLEWIGINPMQYIETLKLLGTKYDYLIDDESDHPTTKYRIDFISHLIRNYPLENYDEIIKNKNNNGRQYPEWGTR